MITVTIAINGAVILARSASRVIDYEDGIRLYKTDSGDRINHNPKDGAIVLAHKLLETMEEV